MKLHFQDQTFSFQLLRAASYAPFGGAEIGECLATAARIREGDFESWHVEWRRTAERVEALAEQALCGQAPRSAREPFLRASNYYRTAEFFLAPDDPRRLATYEKSRTAFQQAITLMDTPVEQVRIAYENHSLPGYFFRVDDSGAPRPTVLALGGFDSTGEELYFFTAAALRRGYHCLTFEGPGQGEPLRVQQIPSRPDYEVPVRAVVDFALQRPEIDPQRLALWGTSMGGYYAPRAAAFEPRIKACIIHGVMYDVWSAMIANKPLLSIVGRRFPRLLDMTLVGRWLRRADPMLRWSITNGMWVFGARTRRELVATIQRFSLKGVLGNVACPTLILHGEKDHFVPSRQAFQVYQELNGPKTLRIFNADEGAEEHCQLGNLSLLHQVAFDWLDHVFGQASPIERYATAPLTGGKSKKKEALR